MRIFIFLFLSISIQAESNPTIFIKLKNHHFSPNLVNIPKVKKVVIMIENEDTTPEELECASLKIEKVINAHSSGKIILQNLEHGRYSFVGEYHEKEARGQFIVE